MSLVADKPIIQKVDFSTAHFAEAATFGGRPHNYPAWLCGILHKKHFYSCWSDATEWRSHVHCGYCQKCRHFTNEKLRYNWLPRAPAPHVFHIQAWTNGQSEIRTNELYLHEIFDLIEILAGREHDTGSADYGELRVVIESSSSGASYKWSVNTLSAQLRRSVLSHLFILYRRALEGDCEIRAEQRWWHKIA